MKRRWMQGGRIALSVVLLAWLLSRVGLNSLISTLREVDSRYYLLAFALFLSGEVISSWRWQVLLASQGVHVSLGRLTVLYFIGGFFNSLLPSTVGGDVVKMYMLASEKGETISAATSVVMDRVTGIVMLFAIALVSLPFAYRLVSPEIRLTVIAFWAIVLGGVWLLRHRKAWANISRRWALIRRVLETQQVQRIVASMEAYDGQTIVRALAIALLFNATLIVVRYLIALAMDVRIHLFYFLIFVPIINLVAMLPISLNGLGVREVAYVYLFGQAGVSTAASIAMSLAFYVMRMIGGLIGGLLHIAEGLRGLAKTVKQNEAEK
ncbi:MAG: flippase-like domain-containing protein [Chloroflexi bacterium]|nr:flippase-like domain-containing protein [Chloroflexota bacterium]